MNTQTTKDYSKLVGREAPVPLAAPKCTASGPLAIDFWACRRPPAALASLAVQKSIASGPLAMEFWACHRPPAALAPLAVQKSIASGPLAMEFWAPLAPDPKLKLFKNKKFQFFFVFII